MKVIQTTPYSFKFSHGILDNLHSYALVQSGEYPYKNMAFIEEIVEDFFDIILDYDEDNDLYIIYFETEGDMSMFKLRYSELL